MTSVPSLPQELAGRAARGTGWVAAGAFVSNGTAAVVLVVLAAYLAPDELGVLAIGQLVFVVLNTLTDFGLWDVLLYTRDRAGRAAGTALTFLLLVSGALAAVVVATSPLVAAFFGEARAAPVIAVSGLLLLCYSVAMIPFALRTRAMQLRQRVFVQAGSVLIGGIVTIVLAAGFGLGIGAMVAGQVVQGVVLVGVSWAVGPRVRPCWDRAAARELFAYGRHSFGAGTLDIAQLNVDYLIVGRMLGSAALGVYSLAFRLAFLPFTLVARVVGSMMFALVCRLDDVRDKHEAVLTYTSTVLLLMTPLTVATMLFAPAVTLLGDAWGPAVPVARWLGLWCLLASVGATAQSALKALGTPQRAFAGSAVQLALVTAGLLALTSQGIEVVAVVRVVAAAATAVLTLVWLQRRTALPVRRLLGLGVLPLAGAAAMTVVTVLSALPFGGHGYDSWLVVVPRAFAALAAYLAVVGVLRPDRLRMLTGQLRRQAPGTRSSARD